LSTALLFVPTIVLYLFGGIGVAPLQAEALAAQPARTGAASGLLTAMQMVIGAVTVQAIGISHDGTPRPLFVGLVVCTAAALFALVSVYRAPVPAAGPQPQQ
jgi:nitrate/nitrite transporter NarK